MKTVAIFGSGLIGMYVGLHLQQNHHVYFIGRSLSWKENLEKAKCISTTTISSNSSTQTSSCKALLVIDEIEENIDFVIIAVKRVGLSKVIDQLQQFLETRKKICLVTLMNGIDACGEIKSSLKGDYDLVEGMWSSNIVQSSNPESNCLNWHMATSGICYLLENQNGIQLCSIFNQCGIETQTHKDIKGIQHGKLLMNLNNAVNALSGISLKDELETYEYRRILANCMLEALNVYEKEGIQPVALTKLPFWVLPYALLYCPGFTFLFPFLIKIDDKATSSMYEDLMNKRDTEIEYLQGYIIRLAEKSGIEVPYCMSVMSKIREREEKREGIVRIAASDILGPC